MSVQIDGSGTGLLYEPARACEMARGNSLEACNGLSGDVVKGRDDIDSIAVRRPHQRAAPQVFVHCGPRIVGIYPAARAGRIAEPGPSEGVAS